MKGTAMATKDRSAREALSEIQRELGVRRRCYTRWIADGKLSDVDATDRIERLEKAADIVERCILLESDAPVVRIAVKPAPERITLQGPGQDEAVPY
jgi:hypothetical protein